MILYQLDTLQLTQEKEKKLSGQRSTGWLKKKILRVHQTAWNHVEAFSMLKKSFLQFERKL